MKATRDSFGEALRELGKINDKIVCLDADLSVSTKSVLFGKAFPDRFFQMGIAEQNMIGTASGLSFMGFIPFACSFGCFLIGRYETIRMSIGYSNANVKLVGTHAGIGIGEDGYSQMGLEDINLMRGLPGMTVLQPCDEKSTWASVEFATTHVGPVYLRLTRQKLPNYYSSTSDLKFPKANVLKQGKDIALLATGATVSEAMVAAQKLGPNFWVIDFCSLKPIDKETILDLAKKCKLLVTVEDHNIIGGLGTAVSEVLCENGLATKLIRLGIQDIYAESAPPADLYEKYGLSANQIVKKISTYL